jgi:hypothetical protein
VIKHIPSLVAAAVTALVIGVALAFAGGAETEDAPGAGAETDRVVVDALAPGLADLVTAFRRRQSAEDILPGGDPVEALKQIGDAQPGEAPTLARRLQPMGGGHVYVWPMADGVCAQWDSAITCGTIPDLRDDGALLGFTYTGGESARWDLLALVNDGIDKISIRLKNGQQVTPAVADNSVLVTLSVPPVEVRWMKPDGTVRSVEIPPGATS